MERTPIQQSFVEGGPAVQQELPTVEGVVTSQPTTPDIVEVPGTDVQLYRRPGVPHPLVPERNPGYVYRKDLVAQVHYAINMNENCMLVGPTGTGKSSLVSQMAALANVPNPRLNLHGETDTLNILGGPQTVVRNGQREVVFQWGLLPRAMVEGWWLTLDEFDSAMQPVLFCLQQMLERGGQLVLDDGNSTIVRRHPMFRLFATANTLGVAGRYRYMHSGTNRINAATLDRFGVMINVGRMTPEQEFRAVKSEVPELEDAFIQGIIKIANDIRDAEEKEEVTCTFSLRRGIQWARAMVYWHPMEAAEFVVFNKLNADDAEVVRQVVQRYFGGEG